MPHDGNQPKGWRGDGKQPKRAAKYGWKPKSSGVETPWLMRRGKQLGLALGILFSIAAVVALILLLWPPEKTTVIIVGAEPAGDAINLQAPLDFHGWQGGRTLAQFIEKDVENAKFSPEKDYPFSLTSQKLTEQLRELVKTSRKEVIIYFGLLGFAKDDSPYLFGAKGEAIEVEKIIDTLAPIAKGEKKDVILLFDAARLHVAPTLGVLHNDFVRSLKDKLSKKIEDNPNLAVICSSSEGQRAWNSDEWGCSGFLVQVVEALRGGAKIRSNNISLLQFFNYVRTNTEEWAAQRYVSPQSPILIASEQMRGRDPIILTQRKTHNKLDEKLRDNAAGYGWLTNHNDGQPDPLKELKALQDKAQTLAQVNPHPAVYTPLAWRRYRELLVRLEQAIRMRDKEAESKLVTELDKLLKRIEDSQGLKFKRVQETNTIWPKLLDTSKPTESAATILADASKRLVPPREAEKHLAYMLHQFWLERGKESSPQESLRVLAIETRQLAERAALACPVDFSGLTYSERLWRLIEPKLKEIDQKRRVAEDLLFCDEFDKAKERFTSVKKEYEALLKKCEPLQKALATYHHVVSEASYLTQWHVSCAEEIQVNKADHLAQMKSLWSNIHQLDNQLSKATLDSPAKELDDIQTTCNEIQSLLKNEMDKFTSQVNLKISDNARTQTSRHRLELLLSFPWPISVEGSNNDHRLSALIKVRQAGDALHKEDQRTKPALPEPEWKNLVIYRAALLGEMLRKINTFASVFDKDLISLNHANWEVNANKLGEGLAYQCELLNNDGSSSPKRSTKLSEEQAEDYSRYTVAFQEVTVEPASSRRDSEWKKVLYDQARRICLDHWDDEKKEPYFKKTAQLYLDDGQIDMEKDAELKPLMELKPLSWKKNGERLTWTSEQKREWPIEIENTLKGSGIQGQIALWAVSKDSTATSKPEKKAAVILGEGSEKRKPFLLDDNNTTISGKLILDGSNASHFTERELKLTFEPKAYFRGQPLEKNEYQVEIRRWPSLIVTEHAMSGKGTFTLTKENNLRVGLGHLAIVLDYSGSMRESGKDDKGNVEYDWKSDTSRIRQAIKGLESLLVKLNDKVDGLSISIRIFSERNAATDKLPPLIDEKKDPAGHNQSVIDQTNMIESTPFRSGTLKSKNGSCVFVPRDHPEQELPLSKVIDELKAIEPHSSTPLLKSMKAAKNLDAKSALLNNESVTLLVLTDGADTSKGVINKKEDPRVEDIHKEFKTEFETSNLSIQIVLFTIDDDERKIAKQQFNPFDKGRVAVREAGNYDDLIRELMASFQVKMQVIKNGTVVPSKEETDKQYFIAQDLNTPLGSLKYSPPLSDDNFSRVWFKDNQRLSFSGGDHLFIKLRNDTNNKVRYTRELFADVMKREDPNGSRFFHKDNWHLTVAKSSPNGKSDGHLTLTLEDDQTKESIKEEIPTLGMNRPKFVWWDVTAEDEADKGKTATSTIHITNRHAYLAPAWDIDKSPNQDQRIKVQAWVSDHDPFERRQKYTFTRNDLKSKDNLWESDDKRLTVSAEPHELINGDNSRDKANCLVVRYRLHESEQVQFRASGFSSLKRTDNHYFPEAKTMTIYFSPFNQEGDPDEKITLKIVNIGELKTKLMKPVIDTLLPMNKDLQGPSTPGN